MIDAVIDLSHHNGTNLGFAAAGGSGILGVIHKATQGLSNVDPIYQTNKAAIRAVAKVIGTEQQARRADGGLVRLVDGIDV